MGRVLLVGGEMGNGVGVEVTDLVERVLCFGGETENGGLVEIIGLMGRVLQVDGETGMVWKGR